MSNHIPNPNFEKREGHQELTHRKNQSALSKSPIRLFSKERHKDSSLYAEALKGYQDTLPRRRRRQVYPISYYLRSSHAHTLSFPAAVLVALSQLKPRSSSFRISSSDCLPFLYA